MILLLLLLLILIVTGALWLVVKIALGIALGLFLAFVAIAALVWWRVRRAMNLRWSWSGRSRDHRSPSVDDRGRSQITVEYRKDPPPI
jgi:membrane protein implicated in regulation of membrane protease activity